ncbi:MAG: alpha/beta fold hydrolase, partial [Myxococcales bacterium]|nr:alpha/beta fold hydrolase [Myxococcales bacterium]
MTRSRYLPCALLAAALCVACSDDDKANRPCDAEPIVMKTAAGVEFVRTPAACFASLADWPYASKTVEIDGLRQAYVDEGKADGPVVLLLHGQPSWSYLYRKMIPLLADAGNRVIAMDHLGMGRSDKPTQIADYSYTGHAQRLEQFIEKLGLKDITLFCQDWGSLIGLRVAGLHPEWFARIAVGDGTLPVVPAGITVYPEVNDPDTVDETLTSPFTAVPEQQPPFYDEKCNLIVPQSGGGFAAWMTYAMKASAFRPSEVLEALTWFPLTPEVEKAYDAPFPSRIYLAGARVFPSLINQLPGANAQAWEGLKAFERPFLTIWAANDASNLGQCETQDNLICAVKGAAGQAHARLDKASHFLQDDQGAEIARRLVDFLKGTVAAAEYNPLCAPPVAADGTGTPCSKDADCAALAAKKCLATGSIGICTV